MKKKRVKVGDVLRDESLTVYVVDLMVNLGEFVVPELV